MIQSGQFQAQPGLESAPTATHVKLLMILKVLPLVAWSFISLTKSNWFHSAPLTAKYNLKNLLGLAPARNICASTLGNLPKITGNAGFAFQREWLSCVHSVYPFQRLIGTVAETFIQVQSSYAGQKLILGINVWMWASGQGRSSRQTSHSKYPNQGQDSFTTT